MMMRAQGGSVPAPFGAIKVAVFDLGGVLLQLRDPLETFKVRMPVTLFLERWLKSPSVREFERGAADAEMFAKSIVREMDLAMDWEEFLQRFDSWPERIFPETATLLDSLPKGVAKVLLSNTNAAHWGRDDIGPSLSGRFDRTFLSFETGLLKPDREAFLQVIGAYDMPAHMFLFFDDNPLNVAAAVETGMQAVLCKGPAEASRVIEKL
jgi:glucose-1-phosphatase